MEKCLILGGTDDWYTTEREVNDALREGYKIINSFSVATQDHPYICIILTKEMEGSK